VPPGRIESTGNSLTRESRQQWTVVIQSASLKEVTPLTAALGVSTPSLYNWDRILSERSVVKINVYNGVDSIATASSSRASWPSRPSWRISISSWHLMHKQNWYIDTDNDTVEDDQEVPEKVALIDDWLSRV
jgi:hypothetical protein